MSLSTENKSSPWLPTYQDAVKTIAGAMAVVPVSFGLDWKTALQLQQTRPSMASTLSNTRVVVPIFGLTLLWQIYTQRISETWIHNKMAEKGWQDQHGIVPFVASNAIAGALSAPLLAVFSGLLARQSPIQALKNLSLRQFGAIMTRESLFIASLCMGERGRKIVRERYANSSSVDIETIEKATTFGCGVLGSLGCHCADTALVLWQNQRQVENSRQLWRGAAVRAFSVGCFALLYPAMQEVVDNSWHKE